MADIKINNTTLTFPKIWYCNAESGNDSAGDGSSTFPFESLSQCHEIASPGDAIKLQPVSDPETFRYVAPFALTKDITIIGAKEKALIGQGGVFPGSNGSHIRFYQCFFEASEAFRNSSTDLVTECYACAIDLAISVWSFPNAQTDNMRFYNCLFLDHNDTYNYNAREDATLYDSVVLAEGVVAEYGNVKFVRSWVNNIYYENIIKPSFTAPGFDDNYSVNSDYTLTAGFSSGNTDVSVYSGDFSWKGSGDSSSTASFLFRNASGAAFKYDVNRFVQVNASEPTETDFTTHGMSSMPKIPVAELAIWEPSGQFTLEYYSSSADGNSAKKLNITSVPKARIALPKAPLDVSGVSQLNGINIVQSLAATGASRFAISIDGIQWKTWNGNSWVDLNALAVDQASADYLMTNGMTATQMTTLSWTELQQLYTGNPTAIAVAYAVEAKAINDTAEIDHVELTITHSDQKWVRDHGQIELEITGSGFIATPSIDCSFKVNYQDTAA